MSSGPMGLDVHEYTYNYTRYVVPDAVQHRISARNAWLVTRIRFWAAANPALLRIRYGTAPQIDIAANGCLCLEPNGAHREDIYVQGQDALLIVEYWYQANPTGINFPVFITP
jgi:hypothetical protein